MQTIYKTDNDDLVFIGTKDGEEYYQDVSESRGWSFMGLRPETEERLRELARERDPMDYLPISYDNFQIIEPYFDRERWEDDMEEDWESYHDVQATRENLDDGQTLHLGFGSGQDIFHYFQSNGIDTYEKYAEHFEEVGLDEETAKKLISFILSRFTMSSIDMKDEEKKAEAEQLKAILCK